MKHQLLAAGFLSISLIWSSPATAARFSQIYAFGDSLTDTGNVFTATGMRFPPPPYFEGRFSNGPVWVEVLAENLGVEVESSAFGGATTGTNNTLDTTLPGLPLPGLQQEIAQFLDRNSAADPNALYTIWAGANDYLPTNSSFTPYNIPDISLSNLEIAVNSLVDIGARNLIVLNLPDLGALPKTQGLNSDGFCPPGLDAVDDADCLNELTASHNDGLSSLFTAYTPGVEITVIDVNSLFDNVISNPGQFGFTNVTEACLNISAFSLCSNPDEYFFWDEQHPTGKGHRLVGELAFRALSVPEPRSTLGLLALGALGAGAVLFGKRNGIPFS